MRQLLHSGCWRAKPLCTMRTTFEERLTFLKRGSDGALIVPSDPFTHDHAALIASLATTSRLPGVYAFARFAHNGGLVAYGIDLDEQLPKAGEYVARILRGAKPGEL